MRRFADGIGQGLEFLRSQLGLIRSVVQNLKGGDFIFVFFDKILEGIHQPFGFFQCIGIETGFNHLILTDTIDSLFGLFLQPHQEIAEVRIVKPIFIFVGLDFNP
ncbi:MAG: hypothetical protein R6V78_16845 [Desulfosarcina sp.]